MPQRALLTESGVSSRRTIQRALEDLEAAKIISIKLQGGSKPSLITWRLSCPETCQIDHARGNARKTTRPTGDASTRPTGDAPLTISNREISSQGILDPLEAALESLRDSGNANQDHLSLIQALNNPSERVKIRQRAETLAISANKDPAAYLLKIALDTPLQLFPQKTAKEREQAQKRQQEIALLSPRYRALYSGVSSESEAAS